MNSAESSFLQIIWMLCVTLCRRFLLSFKRLFLVLDNIMLSLVLLDTDCSVISYVVAGIALETIAGVVSLADKEVDQSKASMFSHRGFLFFCFFSSFYWGQYCSYCWTY